MKNNYKLELTYFNNLITELEANIKTWDLIISLEIMKSELDSYNFEEEEFIYLRDKLNEYFDKLRDNYFFDTIRLINKILLEVKNDYYTHIIENTIYREKTKEEIEKEEKEEEMKWKNKKAVALDI